MKSQTSSTSVKNNSKAPALNIIMNTLIGARPDLTSSSDSANSQMGPTRPNPATTRNIRTSLNEGDLRAGGSVLPPSDPPHALQ